MTAKMPWLILLTLAWRVVARVSADIATPQVDSPNLIFPGDLNLQWSSCDPATVNWFYEGPDGVLSLFMSRVDVTNDTATSARPLPTFSDSFNPNVRSLHRRDESLVQIASSISPFVKQLNVTALRVLPGRYELVAIMTSIFPPFSSNSSVFTVKEGSSTSCLSSSPISSLTSALPSTATSSGFASITSSDVSSTSPTVVPVGGVSSTPVNKGAIAGGVVAGIVVLIAVAVFYFLVIHPRRSRAHSRAPGGPHSHDHATKGGRFHTGASGGRGGGGRWGGLASVDSHIPPSESKVRPYGNTGRQSIGAGVSQDDINSDLSRSGSAHYGSYLGSPSEEKFSSSPSDEMILSAVPYRGPDLKLHIPNNNHLRSSASPPSPFEHRHSQIHAWRSSLDSSSPHGQSHAANPPAPSPASLARKTLPVTPAAPRKPARKPVPAYHETPTETPAVPATLPASSSLPVPTRTPFADPVLPHPAPAYPGHYSTRAERESLKSLSSKSMLKLQKDRSDTSSTNASREEISAPQGLAHKNSFGPGGVEGKQLHYLIPDMPIGHR